MSGSKEASINLTEGPIGKQILLFTVPLLLGNVFQQFYNAADTVIVGKFVGKEALAAVGSSGALINLLVNLFPPKTRKWINVVVSIICLVLLIAFTVWSVQMVSARSIQIQQSPAMGLPLPLVYSCLPIGLGLMALQQLALIIIDIKADPEEEVQPV